MKNINRLRRTLCYLVTPEDSSGVAHCMTELDTMAPVFRNGSALTGIIKTVLWAVLAIVFPLVFIHLTTA